ncbi:MAG: molybdenum cofactor guanylyltransferase [Burkholderiaceae bacterium]|nr:molybdenum cofactor guanylyltransferase [Burkholderiaceae bacterium]
MRDVTGLILAGGRGQRMGGSDKGWSMYRGRPLILSVVERFAPQVGPLLISANRNVTRYAELATVVEDATDLNTESFAGPLIGVASGLRRARTEWTAIVACDTPYLPNDLVVRLYNATLGAGAVAACVRVAGQLEPLFAVVKTTTADGLAAAITAGERAMHRWLASINALAVDFEDAHAFANINRLPQTDTDQRSV